MELGELEIYQLARQVSRDVWVIYQQMDWRDKKTMGDQWICAIDSIGANISEGFGRFHYLDRNRFNYNARGSLLESRHWTEILTERGNISIEESAKIISNLEKLHLRLNNYINSTKQLARK